VSARDDFIDYREGLRRRQAGGGLAITDQERTRLSALLGAWWEQYRRYPAGYAGTFRYIAQRPPSKDAVEAELGSVGHVDMRHRQAARRHRAPDQLPAEKVKALAGELAKRQREGSPHRGPLTLTQISNRVGLDRHRVDQGAQLLDMGWGLLDSDPDFPPDPGYVRWPTIEKARRLPGL
jgi:hypothetical protein